MTARGTYQTAERRRFVAWLVACSLLGLLLLLDLGFISRHVLLVDTQRGLWNLESDAGYPEKFQYLKWLGASVLLLALAVRGMTLAALIAEIDGERPRNANLSSALRIFVLDQAKRNFVKAADRA